MANEGTVVIWHGTAALSGNQTQASVDFCSCTCQSGAYKIAVLIGVSIDCSAEADLLARCRGPLPPDHYLTRHQFFASVSNLHFFFLIICHESGLAAQLVQCTGWWVCTRFCASVMSSSTLCVSLTYTIGSRRLFGSLLVITMLAVCCLSHNTG